MSHVRRAIVSGMEPSEAYRGRAGYLFLDVRQAHEAAGGTIEGSMHVPIGQIRARFGEIPNVRPIVAVCQIGQRSGLVARFLCSMGYDAHNLEGGLERWAGAGLPLVTAAGAPGTVVDGRARDLDGRLL